MSEPAQTIWTLETAAVLGVLSPPRLEAEFSSGRLVHGLGDQALIHRSTDKGTLRGDVLTVEEWELLKASEEAFALTAPLRIARPAVGWVFRDMSRRPWWKDQVAELEHLGALVHREPLPGPGNAVVCLVHVGSAGTARDKWARAAHDQAWRTLREGDGKRSAQLALRLAKRADCLARQLNEHYLAMLAVTYSLAGMKVDSEGVISMARNSKGDDFVARVIDARSRLLDELEPAGHALKPGRRSRHSRAADEFRAVRDQGLEGWYHGRA